MPLILEHEPDVKYREMADIFIAAFGRPSFAQEKEASTGKEVPKGRFLKAGSGTTQETAQETTLEQCTDASGVGNGQEWCEKRGDARVKTRVKTRVETLGKTLGKTPGKIAELLLQDPHMTVPEVAAAISRSESAAQRAILKMQKAGVLRRVGACKSGHWEVLR